MSASVTHEFEQPIVDLENKINELRVFSKERNIDLTNEISNLQHESENLIKKIFNGLTPWQRVQLARHPARPKVMDYAAHAFDEFIELSGDRMYANDHAIKCGLARIGDRRMMVIGTNKGRNMEERISCHFGCPHPEAYRKTIAKMALAERFGLPVVTLVDTPGAFPGIEAEERNQSQAIAECITTTISLRTPVVSIITGEGGSGGALAISTGDRLLILEHAYFSVISPEGCAAILWKDGGRAPEAAAALRITSGELLKLGVVDEIVTEPLGGAHRDVEGMARILRETISSKLDELIHIPIDSLLEARYERFRKIGQFEELQQSAMETAVDEPMVEPETDEDQDRNEPPSDAE